MAQAGHTAPKPGEIRIIPYMPSERFPTRCVVRRWNDHFETWDCVDHFPSREAADAFLAGPKAYAKWCKADKARYRAALDKAEGRS